MNRLEVEEEGKGDSNYYSSGSKPKTATRIIITSRAGLFTKHSVSIITHRIVHCHDRVAYNGNCRRFSSKLTLSASCFMERCRLWFGLSSLGCLGLASVLL